MYSIVQGCQALRDKTAVKARAQAYAVKKAFHFTQALRTKTIAVNKYAS